MIFKRLLHARNRELEYFRIAQAALDVALNFGTWWRLSESGLSTAEAADVMVRALLAQRATVRR